MHSINIGKQFSRSPAGRSPTDGPFSGQKFREELLVPAIEKYEVISVVLDDTEGYGSSFLDEAFGGLTRAPHSIPPDQVFQKIKLVTEDPSLKEEITEYITAPYS